MGLFTSQDTSPPSFIGDKAKEMKMTKKIFLAICLLWAASSTKAFNLDSLKKIMEKALETETEMREENSPVVTLKEFLDSSNPQLDSMEIRDVDNTAKEQGERTITVKASKPRDKCAETCGPAPTLDYN